MAAREPGKGHQLQQDEPQKAKSSPVPQQGQASDAAAIQQQLEETLQACMASGQLPHTTLPQVGSSMTQCTLYSIMHRGWLL